MTRPKKSETGRWENGLEPSLANLTEESVARLLLLLKLKPVLTRLPPAAADPRRICRENPRGACGGNRINGQVGKMAARPLIAARAGFCAWDQPGLGGPSPGWSQEPVRH